MAVDRVIGGVEVEHQFLGRHRMRGDKHIHQNPVDRPGRLGAVLEAAQRRRAGGRRIASGRRPSYLSVRPTWHPLR